MYINSLGLRTVVMAPLASQERIIGPTLILMVDNSSVVVYLNMRLGWHPYLCVIGHERL